MNMHMLELTNDELSEASTDLACLMKGIPSSQRPLLLVLVDALEMIAKELLNRAVGPAAVAQVWPECEVIIRGEPH